VHREAATAFFLHAFFVLSLSASSLYSFLSLKHNMPGYPSTKAFNFIRLQGLVCFWILHLYFAFKLT
jgi:hypothetical protein